MSTRVHAAVVAAFISALGLAACEMPAAGPRVGGQPGASLHYERTGGRVGYHMVSHPMVYDSDPGYYCASKTILYAAITQGAAPPGLRMNELGSFEGTPRQPGEWDIKVTLYGWTCDGGPPSDWTIPVHFFITP